MQLVNKMKEVNLDDSHIINEYGIKQEQLNEEKKAFILYWTEKSPRGKKERWEKEKTFDPTRRFYTWLKNWRERNEKGKAFVNRITPTQSEQATTPLLGPNIPYQVTIRDYTGDTILVYLDTKEGEEVMNFRMYGNNGGQMPAHSLINIKGRQYINSDIKEIGPVRTINDKCLAYIGTLKQDNQKIILDRIWYCTKNKIKGPKTTQDIDKYLGTYYFLKQDND